MNTQEIINSIISEVLEIKHDDIKETDSPDTIDKWTSLTHVLLIDKIEKKLKISFDFDELIEIETIQNLYNVVGTKIK